MRTLTVIPTPQHTNPPPTAVTTRPWPQAARRAPVKQSPLGRVRRAAAELAPETIERIAQRVAQLLRHEPQPLDADRATMPAARDDLMDAGQLAKHLGLTRAWVYEHAQDLGAIQVGNGPRPRLRFDPALAREALRARRYRSDQSGPTKALAHPPRRPRRRSTTTSVPLLPVHEPRTRGIFSRRCRL